MSFKKKIFKFSISQKILAFIGYVYILFVCYTSKIQIINSELPEKLWRENKPFILAFWHGQLMMIGHVWKSKAVLNMLASSHSDGRFGAYIAGHFNLKNVSIMSKNKSPSLRKVFKILKDRNYIGITPDGPRGPARTLAMGPIALAHLTGIEIIPVVFAADRQWVLNSWDKTRIPKPFSRSLVLWGEPIRIPELKRKKNEILDKKRQISREIFESWRLQIEHELNTLTEKCDYLIAKPATIKKKNKRL